MKYAILLFFIGSAYVLSAQHLKEELMQHYPEIIIPNNHQTQPLQGNLRTGIDPALAARLQDTLEIYRDQFNGVGLSAALIFPDGEIWAGGSGIKSFPVNLMESSNALGIGSITKTITAAAIMKLWDMGKLHPDDPIGNYIGPYPNVSGAITLQQCLQHTSGLADYTANADLGNQINSDLTKFWTPEEILQQYIESPLASPGTTWGYCNTNYLLLGMVVESVSGMDYHEFVRKEILQPIGLDSITLGEYEMETYARAHAYADVGGGKIDLIQYGFSMTAIFSTAWAAGAYWSTATDVAHWMRSLLHGEVLSVTALVRMKDVLELSPEFGYGAGLIRYKLGTTDAWGHSGSILFKSIVLHIPELEATVAVISNDNDFVGEAATAIALLQGWLNFTPTNVEFPEEESVLSIYPNPVQPWSILSGLDGSAEMVLIDAQGSSTYRTSASGMQKAMTLESIIPFESLSVGQYFLQIASEKGMKVLPFTIIK